ncbi:hypothetical protein B0J18DRAFT_442167 [Chaetomium sp. MPI-SDFR-AT-0129]|nr:hypothetical protein B0J18DRAFT_442167 [Chaetomium sp. MPI-SDFR-AT-0129]
MSDSHFNEDGSFQAVPQKAQSQNLPGLEKNMEPASQATKLEGAGQAYEYLAAGKLKGCKALITGGDSGIGRSVAVLYAREGADVSIYVDAFGDLHVLVNNASKQIMCEEFTDIDMENVESTFRSNILQMFAVTKYALPHMKKGGSIINTTSTVAFRGTAAMVDYAATKGAIVSFTRALAKNLMPKGIRVNAIAPGPVHTPLQPASRPAEQMEGFGGKSGIGRIGQPSEIAPSFVFLASKDAELYYGQVLHAYPLGD